MREDMQTFKNKTEMNEFEMSECDPLVSDPQDHRERGADSSHEASQRSSEADSGLSAAKVAC